MRASLITQFAVAFFAIGCSDSQTTPDSQISHEMQAPSTSVGTDIETITSGLPSVVSLKNPHSVKRFLEAALGLKFEESEIGFKASSEDIEAEIWALGPDKTLSEFHVQFDPLSDATVDKCLSLTGQILKASGEDIYEIEEKLDRGRDAFRPGNVDAVVLKFKNGAYVRFSIWVKGIQKRAGVVISQQ